MRSITPKSGSSKRSGISASEPARGRDPPGHAPAARGACACRPTKCCMSGVHLATIAESDATGSGAAGPLSPSWRSHTSGEPALVPRECGRLDPARDPPFRDAQGFRVGSAHRRIARLTEPRCPTRPARSAFALRGRKKEDRKLYAKVHEPGARAAAPLVSGPALTGAHPAVAVNRPIAMTTIAPSPRPVRMEALATTPPTSSSE